MVLICITLITNDVSIVSISGVLSLKSTVSGWGVLIKGTAYFLYPSHTPDRTLYSNHVL